MPSNWGKTDSTKLQTEDSNQCDMTCVMSVLVFYLSPDIEKESMNTPRTNRLSNMAIQTCKNKNNYAKFWVCLWKDKVSSTAKHDLCFIGETVEAFNGCPRKASIPAC